MLKIPFIEHTLVGIHIENDHIYWVQVKKLVNKISLVACGSIKVQNTLESALEELKEEIDSDAYYLAISKSNFLRTIHVEEVSIPEDEAEEWINNYNKNKRIEEHSKRHSVALSEWVELEEDVFRIIHLEYDQSAVAEIKKIFEQHELIPSCISSGLFESGYSQVLNTEFIDGFSAILCDHHKNPHLIIYKEGRVFQTHNLDPYESINILIEQCDSLLKTEELNAELTLDSIPLYVYSRSDNTLIKRDIKDLTFTHLSKKESSEKFHPIALGNSIKLAFPQLDSINLVKEHTLLSAQWYYTKKELIRLSVLLFVPLILITLLTYASHKIIETNLFELSQIHEQVSGNLALVETELEEVAELQQKFQTLKKDVQQKVYVTEVFELVATIIPDDVWLTDFKASTDNNVLKIEISGISSNASSIAIFQRKSQDLEQTRSVQLLSTELVSENNTLTSHVKFKMKVHF